MKKLFLSSFILFGFAISGSAQSKGATQQQKIKNPAIEKAEEKKKMEAEQKQVALDKKKAEVNSNLQPDGVFIGSKSEYLKTLKQSTK